ncbi:hypothetical protein TrLO_g14796 [Triparma laevis f. longispina]|uniref:Uncharacterized protein n=1 Tax=Triparma laevis f. longispina TaxID=1714387 RepID=A0A9W7FSN8_9STRA|nr:hypothetical protein TrLO_g14796 [Triparma laevis f. longispina]
MLAPILVTVAVVPILRVTLEAPALISTAYAKITANPGDLMVFKGVVIDLIINVAIAIFIVSFMYCRIERIAWNYSVERREYMANLEAYANEKLQLEKGLLGAGSVNMLSLPLIPSN